MASSCRRRRTSPPPRRGVALDICRRCWSGTSVSSTRTLTFSPLAAHGRGRRSRCRRPTRRRRTIHTLRGSGDRARCRRSVPRLASRPSRAALDSARRSRCARSSDSRSCGASRIFVHQLGAELPRSWITRPLRAIRCRRSAAAGRGRTRRSSSNSEFDQAGRARRRPPSTASSAGCRRRSEEQPGCALATVRRSPNSCEISFQVRFFAAARAAAGELEQRLRTTAASRARPKSTPSDRARRQPLEERECSPLGLHRLAGARLEFRRLACMPGPAAGHGTPRRQPQPVQSSA